MCLFPVLFMGFLSNLVKMLMLGASPIGISRNRQQMQNFLVFPSSFTSHLNSPPAPLKDDQESSPRVRVRDSPDI